MSNDTTIVPSSNHDANGLPMAGENEQHIYWWVASILNTIALVALCIIVREYWINKALRARPLAPFFGQVVADALWLIAYVPYHWSNAITGHLTNASWCLFVSYMAVTCLAVTSASAALMAVCTFDVINSAFRQQAPWCTPKVMVGVWLGSAAFGIAWAAGMNSLGHAGTYRGLYCFITNQGYYDTGGILFLLILFTGVVISIFGYKTYQLVKTNSWRAQAPAQLDSPQLSTPVGSPRPTTPQMARPGTSRGPPGSPNPANGGNTNNGGFRATPGGPTNNGGTRQPGTSTVDPWTVVLHRTILLLAVYFGAFTGNLILSPLNAARVNAPIEVEMLAGWLIKLKPTLDAIVIYMTPSARRWRETQGIAVRKNTIQPSLLISTATGGFGSGITTNNGNNTDGMPSPTSAVLLSRPLSARGRPGTANGDISSARAAGGSPTGKESSKQVRHQNYLVPPTTSGQTTPIQGINGGRPGELDINTDAPFSPMPQPSPDSNGLAELVASPSNVNLATIHTSTSVGDRLVITDVNVNRRASPSPPPPISPVRAGTWMMTENHAVNITTDSPRALAAITAGATGEVATVAAAVSTSSPRSSLRLQQQQPAATPGSGSVGVSINPTPQVSSAATTVANSTTTTNMVPSSHHVMLLATSSSDAV